MLHKSSSNKTLAAKLEKMSELTEIIKVVISTIIYRYVLNIPICLDYVLNLDVEYLQISVN